jgi:hypothetical protein
MSRAAGGASKLEQLVGGCIREHLRAQAVDSHGSISTLLHSGLAGSRCWQLCSSARVGFVRECSRLMQVFQVCDGRLTWSHRAGIVAGSNKGCC